jgi:alkaline phosphatase
MVRRITAVAVPLVVLVLLVNVAPAESPAANVQPDDLSFYHAATTTAPYPLTSAKEVNNVILCIGDGMGQNQITLASMRAVGPEGGLHMERMPVTGLIRTRSANSRVTDSAAAGTAMATGR